jgi:hypothetical protein
MVRRKTRTGPTCPLVRAVKITLDAAHSPDLVLRPGMSVYPTIDMKAASHG